MRTQRGRGDSRSWNHLWANFYNKLGIDPGSVFGWELFYDHKIEEFEEVEK